MAEVVADLARVLQVGRGGAVAVLVLVPVAHEQRVHVVAGLPEQDRGNGGIDATGNGQDDAHVGILARWPWLVAGGERRCAQCCQAP